MTLAGIGCMDSSGRDQTERLLEALLVRVSHKTVLEGLLPVAINGNR